MTTASESKRAVVLLSAGLDSTVAMAEWLADGHGVALALTFDYGQKAAAREIAAAQTIATHYDVPHRVIELPWLKDLLPPSLHVGKTTPLAGTPEELMSVERVWVPNRNGVLLNIAASFAEANQSGFVIFGANAEEGAAFPDNTEEYRKAMSIALAYSTLNAVQVIAPLVQVDKQGIIRRGLALDVPLSRIWSCYEGGEIQCGACASCIRVREAQGLLPQPAGISFAS